MISYIQVLDVFKTFAQGHLQIQKFDFEFREQMPNLATVNEAYPMLFVVPVGGSTLENVREFDIDVYCVDRYQKDRSNVNYVISDTDLILGDLTRWLEEGQDDIEVVRTYTTTPINNDLLDYVGGHVMRMRVQVDRIALCEIPFDGETPVPPTCPSAIVRNSDGSWSDIVPSGGTYIVPDTPVTVTDTDGNTLDTVDVVSVTGGAVVAPDAAYLVEYENGTPIQSGTIPSGGSETIQVPNPIVCEDATVENSDATYTDTVASGGTLVLPDSDVNVNGSLEGSVVSVKDVDINVTDGVNPVTPDAVSVVGNTVTVQVPSAPAPDPAGDFLTATGIVDATIEGAIRDLVDDLQTFGIWDKLEAIYPFVGGTSTTHKFNLKDPRDKDIAFRLVFFGGVTHDANGVTGNGTNGYFRTFYSGSTTNKITNNFGCIYSRTNSISGTDFGQIFEAGFQIRARITGDLFWVRNSSGTVDSESNTDSRGFFAIARDNSSNFRMYNNTVETTKTRASAGNGLGVDIIGLSLQVNATTITDYSNRNLAFMAFGESLNTTEVANMKTAIDTFQTTIGRNV